MLDPAVHAARRAALRTRHPRPILLVGSGERPRNLYLVCVPFRQDSTFLYFTGCTTPDAALLMVNGEETLFLPAPSPDDALWHGHVLTIEEQGAALGFSRVRPASELEQACQPHGADLSTLAVPDLRRTQLAARLTGQTLEFSAQHGSQGLVDAVIAMRRTLGPEEIAEIREAGRVTGRAHRAAIGATRSGLVERDIGALYDAVIAAAGMGNSFHTIATAHGEILHNTESDGVIQDGQLFLLDGGAETRAGYAADVTRTWPVSGRFSPRQRAAYQAVLAAEEAGIAKVAPGVRYREVHFAAARVIARFLKDERLLRCDVDSAVEAGAHAMFFPHGVGHLVGLDAHDLENFGDQATYGPGRERSKQFGTAWLRIDLDLQPGMVVTVEPGFYVVPAILSEPTLVERFGAMVDLERARDWIGFGGIRIEDDIAVTATGHEVLTADIPKQIDALEALVGTAPLALTPSA